MKIFLDDIRNPPDDSWIVARTASEAYFLIRNNARVEITASLDHDLGDNIPTGYELLNWIERDIAMDGFRPRITFAIHSANPVGCRNMQQAIESIQKMLDNQGS